MLPNDVIHLNEKEKAILVFLAKGYGDKEIASEMDLCERTIRHYLTTIHDKLNTKTRPQAVAEAIRRGLIA